MTAAQHAAATSADSAHTADTAAAKDAASNAVEYAYLRAVPRVELGEAVNVGVLVYCQARDFLACATWLDPDRVRALDPDADIDGLAAALGAIAKICRGGAPAGPAGEISLGQRFRWLTAPRSAVLQPGPVHLGLCREPEETLRRLAHGG
ncbi:DUF3037 domain-containing protein [Actinospica sp. MGRD01-02]|uniref:DUF3037 domain-containing protein n=2 Tax=Actinospica acidithermotolerans TaxID=2828514 RepID=A0A941IKZ4_9ACTN|nr:DUF3037 domain-containing protein [Actinospica acidithermotolerans]